MTHGSLFSGIGGFDLAAEWMGWENVFHCEWNEFGKRVLSHYWPNAKRYDDITKTDFTIWRGRVDVLSGGFPCQPYSTAGKRLGKEDERHLWPEMLRAIREIAPRWVVGENVRGLVNWNGGMVFDEVQADLEAAGYEVLPFILPACGKDAPHRRERVWFVAYANGPGRQEQHLTTKPSRKKQPARVAMHTNSASKQGEYIRQTGEGQFNGPNSRDGVNQWQNFPTQSPICGGDDGIPTELDGITFSKWRNESIKAYGNAVVPQVVYEIFKAINEFYEQ